MVTISVQEAPVPEAYTIGSSLAMGKFDYLIDHSH